MLDVEKMEEGIIYISIKYSVTGHRCLCGCRELIILPIVKQDRTSELNDIRWEMKDDDGKLTFIPSVGNFQLPCKSHYIITNGIANLV